LYVVALLVSLGSATRGFALDPSRTIYQYNCQTWSRQYGLPANGINAIAQTDDGYLWLGASLGLIRFDGINFTLVGMAQDPGLRTTEVLNLVASPGGSLWFGIKSSTYGHYDGHGNWTLPTESEMGGAWGSPGVMQSKDGRLWIGGAKASVRSPDGRLQLLFPDESTETFVTCYMEDSRGRIWAGTKKGLYYLDQGKWLKFSESIFDSGIITALAEDQKGQLWVGTDQGLFCFDSQGKHKWIENPNVKILALLVDRHGALWVGTFGTGLLRYFNGAWSSLKMTDGLADDYVLSLCEDKEGDLWIGTRGGLSQLTDVKLLTFGIKEGLNAAIALGVSASPRGGLWVGTPAGAVYFDGKVFDRNYPTNSEFHTGYSKRVLETRGGDVYVLTGKNEVNIYSGGNLIAKHQTTNMPVAMIEDAQGVVVSVAGDLFRVGRGYLTPYPFTNNVKPPLYWVLNMAHGRDGSILVSCGNGICRIKDGVFEQWTASDGLADSEGRWVFEDSGGTIWAGLSTGIARIRGREIRNILRKDGLFDGNIYSMVPDDAGNLWVDSNRGIYCVAQKNLNDFCDGKISRVTCVSYEGPAAIKPADKYGQEESACRSLDGRIWFPSSRGIVLVDPANIHTNTLPPPVHIERARANGQELSISNGITIPPGKGELEFQYSALSYIVPQDIRFRYQLEGYDQQWVEAEDRRLAVYNNLKPGRYTFRVIAANADGVWNNTGDALALRLLPHFYQMVWFYLLCGGLMLAALGGIYAWRVRHIINRQRALQTARDLLEAKVASRTAELATVNASLQHEEAQLKQRTQTLENEIEERKRMQSEIEDIHHELLESSRQAGMAEIATNILHNIGNVLNSVNISASLVVDSVKKSKVASLAKVVALLREHEHDIGTFFTSDPRGKQLSAYLSQLSEHFLEGQKATVKELDSLQSNIGHIKEIVAMQQSYAKISGIKEIINLRELVEDSLRMNEGNLNNHHVEVVLEIEDVPPINVEKHRILQILVNLIRNAKHACQDSRRADKRLTVRVANGEGRIKISVMDNGVGIEPENLTRIFNHGFTTKKDGHGFGLHSGALAAKEMGGSLTVRSDGPGQGAVFTLELPSTTNEDSSNE
jgi:ligand-binding sensor domain-containing protein/signal transduction histidine kinase